MKGLRVSLMVLVGLALLSSAIFGAFAVAKESHSMHTGCFAASAKAADCPPGTFDFWTFHASALRGFSNATVMNFLVLTLALAFLAFWIDLENRIQKKLFLKPLMREARMDEYAAFRPARRWLALHERRDPSAF